MKGKASDICPKCKHCEGLDRFRTMYSCKHYNKYPDSAIGIDSEIECCNFEEVNMNKVEGKVVDFCPKCKNGSVIVWKGVSNIVCEDPYDGMIKNLTSDSNICCSMFEIRTEKKEKEPCDKISLLQHELEMEKLRREIHQLEKEKAAHLKGIERLKNKNEKYLKKLTDQQSTHYKQCARILELECAVNKLQSGEYDDILAKDIEIKSLQAKYEDAMSGWNHTMELHDKLKQESDNLTESNEKLEDKVHKLERRLLDESKRRALDNEFLMSLAHVLYHGEKVFKSYDDILKDIQLLKLANYNLKDDNKGLAERNKSLKSDIDTLQNAVLEIHNIAQVAYNDIDND